MGRQRYWQFRSMHALPGGHSQPSKGTVLQSVQPSVHSVTAHLPLTQWIAAVFATWIDEHELLQAPQ
jgi:hypothetical protein